MHSSLDAFKFDSSPLIIAGPCSAETRDQLFSSARALAEVGIKIFRAGVWKPRTYPGGFEGVGEEALIWLEEIHRTLGLVVATEVASPHHVELALKHQVGLLWIGARTTSNPFAMDELSIALKGVDVPVLVKNPISPDLRLWLGALARLERQGVTHLGAVHRGFAMGRGSEYRNQPYWMIPYELKVECPTLPLLCDPSHITGDRRLIQEVSQEALDRCYDGLMIESHISPEEALSDAEQQLTPSELKKVLDSLRFSCSLPYRGDGIEEIRGQIDSIDDEIIRLLAQREGLVGQIAEWKIRRERTLFQPERYEEMMRDRLRRAQRYGVSGGLVRELFEIIHDRSISFQTELSKQKQEQKL